MLLLACLRRCCDTTSHSPRSKSCPPPPANGICNILKLSPPCEWLVCVGEYLLRSALFVCPPSSLRGDDASLGSGMFLRVLPIADCHCKSNGKHPAVSSISLFLLEMETRASIIVETISKIIVFTWTFANSKVIALSLVCSRAAICSFVSHGSSLYRLSKILTVGCFVPTVLMVIQWFPPLWRIWTLSYQKWHQTQVSGQATGFVVILQAVGPDHVSSRAVLH